MLQVLPTGKKRQLGKRQDKESLDLHGPFGQDAKRKFLAYGYRLGGANFLAFFFKKNQ